jgi:hypothetical protein
LLRISGWVAHGRLTWITHWLLGVTLLRIALWHWVALRRRHHARLLRIPGWIPHHRLPRITHGLLRVTLLRVTLLRVTLLRVTLLRVTLLRIALWHWVALWIALRWRHHTRLLRIAWRISHRLSDRTYLRHW